MYSDELGGDASVTAMTSAEHPAERSSPAHGFPAHNSSAFFVAHLYQQYLLYVLKGFKNSHTIVFSCSNQVM